MDAYVDAIMVNNNLPLATFWWEAETRRAAVEAFLMDMPVDIQYRILSVHEPERAAQLVSPTP